MIVDEIKFNQICSVFFNLYPKINKITVILAEDGSDYCMQFWKHNNVIYNERRNRFQNSSSLSILTGMATSFVFSHLNLELSDDFKEIVLNGLAFRERTNLNLEEKISYIGNNENMRWICDSIMWLFPNVTKVKFMQWNSIRLYTNRDSYVNMVFRGCGFQTRVYEDFPRVRNNTCVC